MTDFVAVANAAEIADPGKLTVEVDDRLLVVIHAGGAWYCLDDVCTHDGGPLGEGPLEEDAIVCPRHAAKFDIRTGAALTMPATEATLVHEVKEENGQIFVRLNEDPQ